MRNYLYLYKTKKLKVFRYNLVRSGWSLRAFLSFGYVWES